MLSKTVSTFYKFVSKPLTTNQGQSNFAVLECVSDPSHSFSATNTNTEVLMFLQEMYIQEDCILECGEMMTTLSCLCHQGKHFLSCYFCCSRFHFPLGFSLVSIFLEFSLTSFLISNNKEEMGHSLEKEWACMGGRKEKGGHDVIIFN